MSDNPDDSNYIHEQPTDALNESSTSDDDDVVEGELTSDTQVFERIKELGRQHGPLRPVRRSYRPSIASRAGSSVGAGVTDDTTNGDDQEEDENGGEREENSGFVNLSALRRVLGNRPKDKPRREPEAAGESSSGEFATASEINSGEVDEDGSAEEREGSNVVRLSALQRVLGNRLNEKPLEQLERTAESPSGELETVSVTVSAAEMSSVSTTEPAEGTEYQQDETTADDVSGQIGSEGGQGTTGGSQDDEGISTKSLSSDTKGSAVIVASQSNLEATKCKKDSIGTTQVSETQGSISAVATKSITGSQRGSEKISSTSGNSGGSTASGTSITAMLPPISAQKTLSAAVVAKKGSHSRSKPAASSRAQSQASTISIETGRSLKAPSNGHSSGMITSTPAPESHMSVSLDLGVSAITGDQSNVSSIPSYDISSKDVNRTSTFSDPTSSRISSEVKKRLTFESGEEGSTEETRGASVTRTLNEFPELEQQGSQASATAPIVPEEQAGRMPAAAHMTAVANVDIPGDESSDASAVNEQQELQQSSQFSHNETNALEENDDSLSRRSTNMAEDEEIIQDNVMSTAGASESEEHDDAEVSNRSAVSNVSDEQVSISSSTAEEIFVGKCMAAKAHVEKNNIVVGNITAMESAMGSDIPRARMRKLEGANIFPQVVLTLSDRAAAEEAKARMAVVNRHPESRGQVVDSPDSSAVSESRYDMSKRFKRQRKVTGGSSMKKHPSEIYSSVLSFVAKTSMTSSQSSRMGQSSQGQRGSTQLKDILPSVDDTDRDEQVVSSQSTSNQAPGTAGVIPDVLPDVLPAARAAPHTALETRPGSVVQSADTNTEHVSASASKSGRHSAGPEMSHLVKGSMESLFSHGEDARTPRRISQQNENMERFQEPVGRPNVPRKLRSADGSKVQDDSSIHSLTTKDRVSSTRSRPSSSVLETSSSSNVDKTSKEPATKDSHTADGVVNSSTPRRGSTAHHVLGKSPSLSRRSLHYATPEDSSDDERSVVLGENGQEETRRKSVVDKRRQIQMLEELRLSRLPQPDPSSSEEELQQRRKKRSADERLGRKSDLSVVPSIRLSGANLTQPSSSSKAGVPRASVVEELATEISGVRPSSSRDKFRGTREELLAERSSGSKTHPGITQEKIGGDDLSQPERDSNSFVVPANVELNALSQSSPASRLQQASSRESEASERSDATVPISTFLEAKKRKKASLFSAAADPGVVVSSTVTHINEEEMTGSFAMDIDNDVAEDDHEASRQVQLPATPLTTLPAAANGTFVVSRKSKTILSSAGEPISPPSSPMRSPRGQVATPGPVVPPMEEEEVERTQGGVQDSSSTPQRSISTRGSQKNVPSMKDRRSVHQASRRSSNVSPIQQSPNKRDPPNQISPLKRPSKRDSAGRSSHPIDSVRRDASEEEIAEASVENQMDVEEPQAESNLSQALKRKPSHQGLFDNALSKSKRSLTASVRTEEDVGQGLGGQSKETSRKSGTSSNRSSVKNKSRSQRVNRQEEEIESDEPVRETRRTTVTNRLEDSDKGTARSQSSKRGETLRERDSRDSTHYRSLRRSSRFSNGGASVVLPTTEDPAQREGDNTGIESSRKRRGESVKAPQRVAVEEAEEPEEPIPSTSRQATSKRVQPAKVVASKAAKKTAPRARAAPKKPKRNDLQALMNNDNLISTQLVRWKCEANNIQPSSAEIENMTDFLNEKLKEMLDLLQEKTLREYGMFSFRELEAIFKSYGLIFGVPNELQCWFAQLLTPEDYKRAQGVLIPPRRDRDT